MTLFACYINVFYIESGTWVIASSLVLEESSSKTKLLKTVKAMNGCSSHRMPL